MADQMEAALAVAAGGCDRHRVVHQPLDIVIRGIARVRPRAGRIAALARRHRAIAGIGQRFQLRAPAMHGLGKAVQQQHQRRISLAGNEGVEGEVRGDGDVLEHGLQSSTGTRHLDRRQVSLSGRDISRQKT